MVIKLWSTLIKSTALLSSIYIHLCVYKCMYFFEWYIMVYLGNKIIVAAQ